MCFLGATVRTDVLGPGTPIHAALARGSTSVPCNGPSAFCAADTVVELSASSVNTVYTEGATLANVLNVKATHSLSSVAVYIEAVSAPTNVTVALASGFVACAYGVIRSFCRALEALPQRVISVAWCTV